MSFSSNSEVKGQIGTLDFRTHQLEVKFPFSQDADSVWALRYDYHYFDIFSDGQFRDAPRSIPTGLHDQSLRVDGVFIDEVTKSSWGIGAGFGLASDEGPSADSGYVVDGSVFYRTSLLAQEGWIFAGHFSNNRNFFNGLPIPGVMYFIHKLKNLRMHLGFPVNHVAYRPTQGLLLKLMSFIGQSTELTGEVQFTEGESAIFGAEWNQSGFIRRQRAEGFDRLYLDDKRAYIGLKALIASKLTFTARGGVIFDRQLFQARNIYSDREGALSVEPAIYGSAHLLYRF